MRSAAGFPKPNPTSFAFQSYQPVSSSAVFRAFTTVKTNSLGSASISVFFFLITAAFRLHFSHECKNLFCALSEELAALGFVRRVVVASERCSAHLGAEGSMIEAYDESVPRKIGKYLALIII